MVQKRKQFTASFKAKVALAAIKGEKTVNHIASQYGVHPNQVTQWKKQLLTESSTLFERSHKKTQGEKDELIDELYRQIGVLKVELDWLKKKI
jgi:putative transposase